MIAASDNFEQTYFFIKHELPDFQIIYYEGKGPNMIQFLLQAQCLQNSSSHISLYKLHVLNKTLRTWDVKYRKNKYEAWCQENFIVLLMFNLSICIISIF